MRFKRDYQIIKGEINLTPLVDVIFQQIIFFMLTSSFIMQPGIKIKLPTAITSDVIREKEIFVNISEDGTIFFKGKIVKIGEFQKLLIGEVKNTKKQIILIIKADRNTKHGIVVDVMDKAREVGIGRIAIATTPELER